MKNKFYMTIYDMYRNSGLSEQELTKYLWNELFEVKSIDFSREELSYEQ